MSGECFDGAGVVDLVITDLGAFSIDKTGAGMVLIELAEGATFDEIKAKTEAPLPSR